MKASSRSSSLYEPFLDEDEARGEAGRGVVLFHRRSWHPWDLLSGHAVTITTQEIRVAASPMLLACCGDKRTKSSLPLADVRDLALQPGCLGTLWPTIYVYSRHDPHHPALRLRALRGASQVFKALREAVSEVHSRELLSPDL